MTTEAYFAFGSTLANMVNVETITDSPQVLDFGRIPSVAPIKERDLAGILTRSGKINSRLMIDIPSDASRIALNTALFGDQTTASIELYLSLLSDTGHYLPYLVVIDRPVEQEDYTLAPGGTYVQHVAYNLFNARVQSVTKTANATLTSSERYILGDTSGGGFTNTLCAANAVQADTVISIRKTAAANTLSYKRGGTDTLNGATATLTLTALNGWVDIKSDGVSAWTTI